MCRFDFPRFFGGRRCVEERKRKKKRKEKKERKERQEFSKIEANGERQEIELFANTVVKGVREPLWDTATLNADRNEDQDDACPFFIWRDRGLVTIPSISEFLFFFLFLFFYYEFTNVSSPCLFQTIFQTRIDSAATLALRAAGSLTDCDTLCRYHAKTTPSTKIVPVSPLAMRVGSTALVRAVQTIRNV